MTSCIPTKSYDRCHVTSLVYVWLTYSTYRVMSGIYNEDARVKCLDTERDALLAFKHGIHVNDCSLLASWGGGGSNHDCCQWDGIRCDNHTYNIISLQLPGIFKYSSCLEGTLNGSLVTLQRLKYLAFLDLSSNKLQFDKHAMKSIGRLCRLQTLKLNDNNITLDFSDVLESLSLCAHKSLVSVTLSNTRLWGSVPKIINNFQSLKALYVGSNQLNGTINETIGELSSLEELDLSSNNLNGLVSYTHFSNLSRLSALDLSYNRGLVFNLGDDDWTPPFQIRELGLASCNIGPTFPKWLLTKKHLSNLDMSSAQISDTVPESFWRLVSTTLQHLNMSNNMIYGVLPDFPLTFQVLNQFDMSSNNLSGAIPSSLRNYVVELILNNNKLSQGLYHFLCPNSKVTYLVFLDLSDNLFSETLPDCWRYFPRLRILKLQNNNIGGKFPSSIVSLSVLQALHLRNNTISGELPTSWLNYTYLAVLDLAYNSLSGHIPHTFGNGFKNLRVLSLRFNRFSMDIPSSLCQLSSLQVLDLSSNHLSGALPKCLSDLTTMVSTKHFPQTFESNYTFPSSLFDSDISWFMWKRREHSFDDLSGLYKGIDVSDNNLQGSIPDQVSDLAGLVFLNFSQNNFSRNIPTGIGKLVSLEFLDLSRNHLSGEIPTSLGSINYLEILDLSNNNLSGTIPLGTQLQGFDASAYEGNPGLCGAPLSTCPRGKPTSVVQNRDNVAQDNVHKSDESDDIFLGLYISVVLGFITGFWAVCGTLVLKQSWRRTFFRFYADAKDRFYAMVVNIARTSRRS